jgi:hypothetical protein
MRTPAYTAAEHDTRRHARRGLAIYFAVLVPFSAVFETLMIVGGGSSWVWALMWTPGAASIVARLILREGFADVSFRLAAPRGKSHRDCGAIPDSHWTDLLWHRVDPRARPLQAAARRVGRTVRRGFHSSHRGIRDQSCTSRHHRGCRQRPRRRRRRDRLARLHAHPADRCRRA